MAAKSPRALWAYLKRAVQKMFARRRAKGACEGDAPLPPGNGQTGSERVFAEKSVEQRKMAAELNLENERARTAFSRLCDEIALVVNLNGHNGDCRK